MPKPYSDQTCACIATNHDLHTAGECDEPPKTMGGICVTCQYADTYREPDPKYVCWNCGCYFNNQRTWHLLNINEAWLGCCPACWPKRPK